MDFFGGPFDSKMYFYVACLAIHIVGRLGLFGVYRVLLQYSCLLVGLRNLYNPFLDIIKNLVNIAQYYFFPIFFLCIKVRGGSF